MYFFRPLGVGALAWALLISPAYGQVYKWQDSQGRVHYSDTPPKADHGYREVTNELPHLHRMEPLRKGPMTSTASQPDSRAKPSTPVPTAGSAYYYDSQTYGADLSQRQCDRYRTELEHIQKQLRSGYKESKGNRLRDRRRELSEKLYRECRN